MSEINKIGIICDGQLGRMMVEDGLRMNPNLEFYALGENGENSPAAQVGAHQVDGSITDPDAIRRLAGMVDVVTTEIEHIDTTAPIELVNKDHNFQASPHSWAIIQDKVLQKRYLHKLGIPVARFVELSGPASLLAAQGMFGEDLIIKQRRGGYDGRGNSNGDSNTTWESVIEEFGGAVDQDALYAEEKVRFQRELSVVGARDMAGRIAMYPVVEVINKDGKICDIVKAPAEIDPRVAAAAAELGRTTIEAFEGAGVFAVEMFQDNNDNVLVNEVAPRVHNTGHWTDIGTATSQFEQHIRAISGAPLGSTEAIYPAAAMINVLATKSREYRPVMSTTQPGLNGHIRWYGKAPKSDGSDRKIGHVTAVGSDMEEAIHYARVLHDRAITL